MMMRYVRHRSTMSRAMLSSTLSSYDSSRSLPFTPLNYHHNHRISIRSKSIFVSKYNQLQVSAKDILDYLSQQGIHDTRQTSSHIILQECPFCQKPTHNKADNQHKCYIQIGGGAYFCHRCGSGGSWFDLKLKLGKPISLTGGSETFKPTTPTPTTKLTSTTTSAMGSTERKFQEFLQQSNTTTNKHVPPLPMPPAKLQGVYSTQLLDQQPNECFTYLQEKRGLTARTLRKYGVGRAEYSFLDDNNEWKKTDCVTFPWMMTAKDVQTQEQLRGAEAVKVDEKDASYVTRRIKARSLERKSWQRLDPPGGGWGLFGLHTVPKDSKEIVITEGEYDAMAVWQATGRPAVSLPNGCRSLPVEVLPLLEDFEKIYLWMDNDGPGKEGAEVFAKKIGLERCYIVQPTLDGEAAPKDANEALLRKMDLEQMIKDARLTPHEQVSTFEEMRQSVLHEIVYPDKYVGTPMPSLPSLTNVVKGFRRGEMTVITGPTGSGKTTFLGQLSLDMAEQGVNMLWGSFEIKNTRLLQKLLQQFAREPLPAGDPSQMNKLEAIADRFTELPMYFLKFHGGSDVEDVLDAMDYAVYVNDVEHIILDNMQFMITRQTNRSTFDKFDIQDVAIEKFRKFATDRNVHVSLVVHPRKEQESTTLSMSSIYGSAKATQEADTVLILQYDGKRKWIDVKKNRFTGDLGHVPLHFDRRSGRYSEDPSVATQPVRPSSSSPKSAAGYNKDHWKNMGISS